jgi:hypothetical protein
MYSLFWGGRSPTGSPHWLGSGLSESAKVKWWAYPSQPGVCWDSRRAAPYDVHDRSDLDVPVGTEEIAMIVTVSISKRCDKVFGSLCNVLIKCLVIWSGTELSHWQAVGRKRAGPHNERHKLFTAQGGTRAGELWAVKRDSNSFSLKKFTE